MTPLTDTEQIRLKKLSITEIEKEVETFNTNYLSSRGKLIHILEYLDITKRYRENKAYKDSSFEDYIKTRFGISPKTYGQERYVFNAYPEEVKKYGLGTVIRTAQICGTKNIDQAMKYINGKEEAAGTRLDVDKIFKYAHKFQHKKPVVKEKKIAECKKCQELQKVNTSLIAEVKAKDEQIEKLKTALNQAKLELSKYKQIRSIFQKQFTEATL